MEQLLPLSINFNEVIADIQGRNYYLKSGISGKVSSEGTTRAELNLELESTKEKAKNGAESLSSGIRVKNITIPTEAGNIEIDEKSESITFNLQVEQEEGTKLNVPIKITKEGLELEIRLSNSIKNLINPVKTTYGLKQKGANMYLSIEKSITKRWSNNNITSSYKAYSEYGTKLDYDGSDKGLSYETALSYALVHNLQSLKVEGLEGDKVIDWDEVIIYLKKHYKKAAEKLLPIIEEFKKMLLIL